MQTIIADLTDDYTDVTGYYSTHFPKSGPPFVRDATAHFVRDHKHYLLTSGTTGYFPNPSEVAVADTWHGPYTVLGDPCPGDESQTSWHSQVSSVFKVPGKKDLYIAIADRWLPNDMDWEYPVYARAFEKNFHPERSIECDPAVVERMRSRPRDNTSVANYVWLPLRFEEPTPEHPNGMVYMDWHDEWRIEDYE